MQHAPALPIEPDLDPKVASRITALPTTDRMKQALRLVAAGWTYRDAAKAVGYASQKDVYGWAKRAGLTDVHTSQLVAGFRRVAHLSAQELERRLEEDTGSISTKDLAVVAGIASDKIARYESWVGWQRRRPCGHARIRSATCSSGWRRRVGRG